jgi:hypothetical protein
VEDRASAISACVSALIACDQQNTSVNADACRGALLIRGTGVCAVDVLDSGMPTVGSVSNAIYSNGSTASLDSALRAFVDAVQAGCFQSGAPDLSALGTGLGFSPTPTDKFQLVDQLNTFPGGISCHANESVRAVTPLLDSALSLLRQFHHTCVVC